MRIGVKGRNFDVSEEVRQKVGKRFEKIGKQVSDLAQVDIELSEERNPSIRDSLRSRGDALPEGGHAAIEDQRRQHVDRGLGLRGRAVAAGQEAPRQAPRQATCAGAAGPGRVPLR